MKPENDSTAPGSAIIREGGNAFWDDYTLDDNPYPAHTERHRRWAEGWTLAKLELNLKAEKRTKET